jgi:hypothetical protein
MKVLHGAEAGGFGSKKGSASTSFPEPFIPGLKSPGFSGHDINKHKCLDGKKNRLFNSTG